MTRPVSGSSSAGWPLSSCCSSTPAASTSRSAAARCERSAPGSKASRSRARSSARASSAATASPATRTSPPSLTSTQVGLQVVMGHAGLVSEGQALQQLHRPVRGIETGQSLGGQALGQRRCIARIVGDVGPAVLHAALHHRGDLRMVQARGAPHGLLPALQRCSIGGLHPRQDEHQFLAAARIGNPPGHRALALAEQTQQLQPAEPAHGGGARRRSGVCAVGGHGSRLNPVAMPGSGANSG